MRYMHRPTLIDAYHVNRERWPRWVCKAINKGFIRVYIDGSMSVRTRTGDWVLVADGDYIVKETNEAFYVISSLLFPTLYEPLKKGD